MEIPASASVPESSANTPTSESSSGPSTFIHAHPDSSSAPTGKTSSPKTPSGATMDSSSRVRVIEKKSRPSTQSGVLAPLSRRQMQNAPSNMESV